MSASSALLPVIFRDPVSCRRSDRKSPVSVDAPCSLWTHSFETWWYPPSPRPARRPTSHSPSASSRANSARATLEALIAELRGAAPDVVIGAGGGKAIDAAKGVSRALGAAMVSVPTSASNDAPTSSIFVLYDDSHRLLSVEKLGRNPELVVVDSAVIVERRLPYCSPASATLSRSASR